MAMTGDLTPPEQPWWQSSLRCPDCGAAPREEGGGNGCSRCGWHRQERRDWRGHQPRPLLIEHQRHNAADPEQQLQQLQTQAPRLSYQGPKALRDSTAFLSVLQQELPPGARVLDLGCGPRDQAEPVQSIGLRYLGVDVAGEAPDLLVDAHALPFADQSFEAVFSYAVLEHLRDPLVALCEIARVLKPGGLYLGSVSLGEPFHASYFHHSAWGLLAWLDQLPQLRAERLWATCDTLTSLSGMGRYPKVIRAGLALLDRLHQSLPILAPRKRRWSRKSREIDALHRAGSIGFVIRKYDSL